MTSRKEFSQFLWETLHQKEYAWLNPECPIDSDEEVPEILIAKPLVQDLLPRLRQYPEVKACRASFRYHHTLAVFSFKEWSFSINFVHKMVSQNLFFLSEEAVLGRRVQQSTGIYFPGVEHLWEYCVLKAFLNRRGMNEREYRFFQEYHILVQEDLVELCNEKYATDFKDIYALTEYRAEAKRAMVQRLKEMPINRLTRVLNIRWHNFLGNLRREARMI